MPPRRTRTPTSGPRTSRPPARAARPRRWARRTRRRRDAGTPVRASRPLRSADADHLADGRRPAAALEDEQELVAAAAHPTAALERDRPVAADDTAAGRGDDALAAHEQRADAPLRGGGVGHLAGHLDRL